MSASKGSKTRTRKLAVNAGFRSGFEKKTCETLQMCKVDFEYEPKDKEVTYTVPEVKSVYKPDIVLDNGIYLELKGLMDLADRKKHELLRDQFPELDIRLVFQNPYLKIRKGSKTTYADWADKAGIKWGVVPDIVEWAKEQG